MKLSYRQAVPKDAARLFEVRRLSILGLAPQGITLASAESWADMLTPAGMEQKLRDLEIWVVEAKSGIAGWGAIRGNHLEGLYIRPECAEQGVGTGLLAMLEGFVRARGHAFIQAEASPNAERFYLRRDYHFEGARRFEQARPMTRRLMVA